MLQGNHCQHIGFNNINIPGCKHIAVSVPLVVDGTLFYAGQWKFYNNLRTYFSVIDVIWLTREETGWFFPAGSEGDILLKYLEDGHVIDATLNNVCGLRERIRTLNLTRREAELSPLFLSCMNMKAISAATGISAKDVLANGRRIKCLTCVDDFTEECLTITAAFGISGVQATRILDSIALFRGHTATIRTDQGPEFTCRALEQWPLSMAWNYSLYG